MPGDSSAPPSIAQLLDAARAAWHAARQPLPRLRTSAAQEHPPTVYFCTPDYRPPTGGIRVAYRHVDLLNAAGIPAAVLHRRAGFRCSWFENDTRVCASGQVRIGPKDLVVVSELAASLALELPRGHRFVVFNQGPFLTWRSVSEGDVRRYVRSPELAAIVTVSDHAAAMLSYAAPGTPVVRVHSSIDPDLFFSTAEPRRRTIAYMPRRGRDEADQVLGMLGGRGALDGWEVMPIEGVSEREVGERLRTATVFLSLAHHEGFGLPAAEAMACGAYVVGFDGFGGREFFRREFSSPISAGDVVAFARALEDVLERETRDPGWCAERGEAAARYVAAEYSPERERRDVVGVYRALLAGLDVGSALAAAATINVPAGAQAAR
jgi:Glycosyl transferases group 1